MPEAARRGRNPLRRGTPTEQRSGLEPPPPLTAEPAAAWRRRPGRSRLRRAAAVSVGVHAAAALLVLAWWLPTPPAAEAPATVEVLFGNNADAPGAPERSAPPSQAAPAPVAAASAEAAAPTVEETDQPTPTAASAPPEAAHPAASMAVRLGEGEVGLKLVGPLDPGLIEATADPGNRAPKFPEIAARQHQFGVVVIRMHVDTQGRVADVEVLESSGHPALDRAAREALALWHFIPALQAGVAVPSFRDQAINFVQEMPSDQD